MRRTLATFAAAALLSASLAHAWPSHPLVNVPLAIGPGQQAALANAHDGVGGAIVIWADSSGTTHYDLRATHVLANGQIDPAWPAGGVAVCTASGDQSSAHAVTDGAGGAIITWADERTGDFDLYAQRVLANGAIAPGWPANGAVVAGGIGDQYAGSATGSHVPTISDGAGGAITTWADSRSGHQDIYVHRIRSTGVDPVWPVNGRAICTAIDAQSAPTLVTDMAGGAVVAWHDSRGGGLSTSDIYVHHVTAAGVLDADFPADGQVLCGAANDQRYPEGVSDGFGGAVFAWHDRRNGTDFDIYAQHVWADAYTSFPVNGVAVCVQPYNQARVRAVSDGANGMLLEWHDNRTGVSESVYAHHLLPDCVIDPAWPAHGLAVREGIGDFFVGAVYPHGIASDGAGGAVITWQDERSGGNDIYAQRVQPGGTFHPAWPAGGRAVSTAAGEQTAPIAVAVGGGKVVIAWTDARSGAWDAYCQGLTASGELGRVDLVASGIALPQLARGSLDWGDYDADGDLDLLMTGAGGSSQTHLYANNAGTLSPVSVGLIGVEWSSAEWGDYDADGDLDIALAGYSSGLALSRIYRNDGGDVFTDIGAGLPGVWAASVAWGDYDNDGDLDLLLAGEQNNTLPIARIYRNEDGTFNPTSYALTGVAHGDAEWGDYDNDGDLDLILCGNTGGYPLTTLYINEVADFFRFRVAPVSLPWVESMDGSLGWGDYDADGDLDLVLSGWDESVRHLAIFRNDNGDFSDIDANLPGISSGAVAWGDYDNDGDLDLLASGYWAGGSTGLSAIYRNDAGVFVDAQAGLPGRYYSAVAWADADNDGDLDVTISGTTNGFNPLTHHFRSEGAPPDAPPAAPSGLTATRDGDFVEFSWAPSTDAETPAAGLSYNLRIGSAEGGDDHMPAMSGASGTRRVVSRGNASSQTTWRVQIPPGPPIHWSVQAIDGAFVGSAWAAAQPIVGVGDRDATALETGAGLARPNPFRASTEIRFTLARAGRLEAAVFDLSGRCVRQLVHGERAAGVHAISWDGRAASGARMPAGLYVVRLESEGASFSRKVVLGE